MSVRASAAVALTSPLTITGVVMSGLTPSDETSHGTRFRHSRRHDDTTARRHDEILAVACLPSFDDGVSEQEGSKERRKPECLLLFSPLLSCSCRRDQECSATVNPARVDYSTRSDRIGSTRAARRAGNQLAAAAKDRSRDVPGARAERDAEPELARSPGARLLGLWPPPRML